MTRRPSSTSCGASFMAMPLGSAMKTSSASATASSTWAKGVFRSIWGQAAESGRPA